MIPALNGLSTGDFTMKEPPSKTYRLDTDSGHITGFTDGREAAAQAIGKILNTERFAHLIYSWRYGAELADLPGNPVTYAYPEIERRVTEALTQDSRVVSVDGFVFTHEHGTVTCMCTAHTVFGDIAIRKDVTI